MPTAYVAMLRDGVCGGLALVWSEALEQMVAEETEDGGVGRQRRYDCLSW